MAIKKKKSVAGKKHKLLSAMLAVTMATSFIYPTTITLADSAENTESVATLVDAEKEEKEKTAEEKSEESYIDYEKYEQDPELYNGGDEDYSGSGGSSNKAMEAIGKGVEIYSQGKQIYDTAKEIKEATSAAKETADAVKGTADATKGTADTAKAAGGVIDKVGAGIGVAAGVYGLVTGEGDIGSTAVTLSELSQNLGDLGVDIGVGAGFADAMDVIGSVFGQKLSDSVSYRSVGSHGKYTCTTQTPAPTINEDVSVKCVGVPIHGAQFVVPPVLNLSAHPTSGGKKTLAGAGVPWRCGHHGCHPVDGVAVTVEYNVYEGSVTMGNDLYFDESTFNYDANFDSESFSVEGGYQYSPYGAGEYGFGSLSDGIAEYYKYNTDYDQFMNGGYYDTDGLWHSGSGSGGYFDADGNWHNGFSGDGYYDSDGLWHSGSNGLDGSGNAYDWNSQYGDLFNKDLHDGDGSYNANGFDWSSSSGNGGYFDADGNWHSGQNPYSNGYYDANGKWIDGYTGGYYDSDGNWYDGGMYGSDDLDSYFGNGSNNGKFTFGMSDDLTGTDAFNATVSAKEALTEGGYVGEDGTIYDAEGNSWGSAAAAGLIAFEEGSDELNNILAQGGWIDVNGNVYDADGNLVGYVVPVGSLDKVEKDAFDDDSMFAKSQAIFQEFLNSLSNANGGDASLMDRLTGSSTKGSVLSTLKSALGLTSEDDIRKETMTPQQMYDVARDILKALGYTDEDIAKGLNYDKGSAYTEPDKAWDMNRITTLQKNFKIDTHIRLPKKAKSVTGAAGQFGAVKAAVTKK